MRERQGGVQEGKELAWELLRCGVWLGPGFAGCGSTCCLSSVMPLLGPQANLGHGGRVAGASVRCCAFRGAGLAGLHLHPAGPGQRPTGRGEAQVPQHSARCAGRDLRGTVRLTHARPSSALFPGPSFPATLIFQAPISSVASHAHLIRSHSLDLHTWASFHYSPSGCSGEHTPRWAPLIPLRSSSVSR